MHQLIYRRPARQILEVEEPVDEMLDSVHISQLVCDSLNEFTDVYSSCQEFERTAAEFQAMFAVNCAAYLSVVGTTLARLGWLKPLDQKNRGLGGSELSKLRVEEGRFVIGNIAITGARSQIMGCHMIATNSSFSELHHTECQSVWTFPPSTVLTPYLPFTICPTTADLPCEHRFDQYTAAQTLPPEQRHWFIGVAGANTAHLHKAQGDRQPQASPVMHYGITGAPVLSCVLEHEEEGWLHVVGSDFSRVLKACYIIRHVMEGAVFLLQGHMHEHVDRAPLYSSVLERIAPRRSGRGYDKTGLAKIESVCGAINATLRERYHEAATSAIGLALAHCAIWGLGKTFTKYCPDRSCILPNEKVVTVSHELFTAGRDREMWSTGVASLFGHQCEWCSVLQNLSTLAKYHGRQFAAERSNRMMKMAKISDLSGVYMELSIIQAWYLELHPEKPYGLLQTCQVYRVPLFRYSCFTAHMNLFRWMQRTTLGVQILLQMWAG